MNKQLQPINRHEVDLSDRIAAALPEDIRADYYREMRHCQSLPENDEMLRILRIMQFLTLLIERAPDRVVEERARLEALFAEAAAYHRHLDERISGLPPAIAEGIGPDVIAARINESLRQQFDQSTIPQTAATLSALASGMKKTTAEFDQTARKLGDAYSGAVAETTRAIREMKEAVTDAGHAARFAINTLSHDFRQDYRWSLLNVCAWTLGAGLVLGGAAGWWVTSSLQPAPTQTCVAAPAVPANPATKAAVGTRRHVGR